MESAEIKSIKTWPKSVIRAVAIANVLLGGLGLYLQVDSALRFIQRSQLGFSTPLVYWITASISFALTLATFLSSFFLWRTDRRALLLCNWLFGTELVYWVGGSMLDVMLVTSKYEWAHRFVMSTATASGIGNMGIAPQVLVLYPVWALILLNIAYRRLVR
jgi:hypothetical protein